MHLMLNQNAGQIGPVMSGLQHENLNGGANPPKIAVQTAQITAENLAPLNAEFGCHPG